MELIQYESYEQFKGRLDNELQSTTESFVRIGYLLKQARDTDILKESGYQTVNEFAAAEYNIDKSQVSRFIRINDRFSEGGNSYILKEQYREFGYAKLALMLQLPDEINEELSPGFSKAEIQTIKEEVDAERELSDIEVMIEEQPQWQQDEESLIYKAFRQLFHDEPELYLNVCRAKTEKELFSVLAPMGEVIYTVRIAGTGKIMISIKETVEDIVFTNIRSNGKEHGSKQEVNEIIKHMIPMEQGKEKEHWKQMYEEEWPIQEETKQEPKKQEKKPEKKQSRVTVVKKKEEVAPVQPDNEQESEKDAVNVEVVPGAQAEITDMKKVTEAAEQEIKKAEIMAVPYHTKEEEMEVVSGEVESPSAQVNTQREPDSVMEDIPKNTDNEPSAISEEEYEEKKRTYKQLFNQACEDASGNVDMDMYLTARQHMKAAMEYLEKLEQLDNTEIIEYQEEDE